MSRFATSQSFFVLLAVLVGVLMACSLGRTAAPPPEHSFAAATNTPRPTFTSTAANTNASPMTGAANASRAIVPSPIAITSPTAAIADPAVSPTTAPTAAIVATPTRLLLPTATATRPAPPTATFAPSPTSPPNIEPTASPADGEPDPDAPPTESDEPSPAATATTPPPTATAPPPAWTFVGLRTVPEGESLFVIGELVNSTGLSRQGVVISGLFFDENNNLITSGVDTLSYIPVEVIPAGAHVPFELTIDSVAPIYRFDLLATSEVAENLPPRQDFAVTNVTDWRAEEGLYCLKGTVQNPGAPLEEFLSLIVILYDGAGRVASFGEYSAPSPEKIVGEQTAPFELCIDPLGQGVDHYQIKALGR